jgi:hypothetical protein
VNYSKAFRDYQFTHVFCEACGVTTQEWPHHIRSRGAGGADEASNLLELCREHHAEYHTMGRLRFIEHFPALEEKIKAALAWRKT